jgi:pimeloyl-ACP methyl ester carboxylesterase
VNAVEVRQARVEDAEAIAAVNGATLWVEEAGDGPAVVLLHGSLGDSRLWDERFDSVAERFRTIRYDHRFFGRSEAPDAPYSLVDDARGVLDALAIDRAALVGLSLRGRIAIDATLLYPERVWALVPVRAASIWTVSTRPSRRPSSRRRLSAATTRPPLRSISRFGRARGVQRRGARVPRGRSRPLSWIIDTDTASDDAVDRGDAPFRRRRTGRRPVAAPDGGRPPGRDGPGAERRRRLRIDRDAFLGLLRDALG